MSKKASHHNKAAGIKRVPASVQLLETRLTSYDEEVREQAWKGIKNLGAPEGPLLEKIVEQFDHQNWYVREAACKAIGFCVDADHATLACSSAEPLLEHPDPHVRYCGGRALIELEERVRVAVDALSYKSGKADPEQIAKVAAPAERAAEMLAQRLQHEDHKIRKNALDALSRMGSLCIPYATTICALVSDPSLPVRNELLRVIGRLGTYLEEGITVVAESLANENPKIVRNARVTLLELAKVCGPQVAAAAAEPLKSEDRATKIAALETLKQLGALAAPHGADMAELLEEMDPDIRLLAVRSIIAAGKAMSTHQQEIKKRLQHEHPDVVRAAVQTLRGLAHLCSKFARGAHRDLEEEGDDLATRMHAIEILGGAGHNAKPYLEELAKALEEKDWGMRRVAIEALADLKEHAEPAGTEVARRLLHHDPDVRRAAAEALGRMGLHAGEFGHRVEGLLDTEEDEDVKATCAAACEMLYEAGMAHGN